MVRFCSFCEKFGTRYNKWADVGLSDRWDRALGSSDNFFVVPSLGAMVPGYVLIVPCFHATCFGNIESHYFPELDSFLAETRKTVARLFGPHVLFEHGPIEDSGVAGSCVTHAHLHIVPTPSDSYITTELDRHFVRKPILTLHDLRSIASEQGDYLFFENLSGLKLAFPIKSAVPCQYLRKLLACQLDMVNLWDWRTHPGIENIDKTVELWRKEDDGG